MRFFFYGTLMDAAVRAAVLGSSARLLVIEPATLCGWRRAPVRGRGYPIIVPAAGRTMAGMLAARIDAAAAARLDRFEGAEYRRLRVTARRMAGDRVSCWVYAAANTRAAGAACWDFNRWRRRDRAALLRRLVAGARCY